MKTDHEAEQPHYHTAFLRDLDGNKIEIVTFAGNVAILVNRHAFSAAETLLSRFSSQNFSIVR